MLYNNNSNFYYCLIHAPHKVYHKQIYIDGGGGGSSGSGNGSSGGTILLGSEESLHFKWTSTKKVVVAAEAEAVAVALLATINIRSKNVVSVVSFKF